MISAEGMASMTLISKLGEPSVEASFPIHLQRLSADFELFWVAKYSASSQFAFNWRQDELSYAPALNYHLCSTRQG